MTHIPSKYTRKLVIALLEEGISQISISERLMISPITFKNHYWKEIKDHNNLLVVQDLYKRHNLGDPKEIMEKLAIWNKQND